MKANLPTDWIPVFAASRDRADQLAALEDAELVFVIGAALPASLLKSAPRLRFIQKLGAGTDKIDVDHCRANDIGLARLSGGNAAAVAEHALMLILASLRNLVTLDATVRRGAWEKEAARAKNRQISGRQIGIIGFGAIGQALARLLTGFDARIVYFDPVVQDVIHGAVPVTFETLLATSDIVSLHSPLTPGARKLIGADELGMMKPGAVLINCARGGLIDEAALLKMLDSGRIAHAGLDVFETEPPGESALLRHPSTTLTPHCAGATIDNFVRILERGIDNAKAYLATGAIPPADAVVVPQRSR